MDLDEITAHLERLQVRDAAHHLALRALCAQSSPTRESLRRSAEAAQAELLAQPLPDDLRELFVQTLTQLFREPLQ